MALPEDGTAIPLNMDDQRVMGMAAHTRTYSPMD